MLMSAAEFTEWQAYFDIYPFTIDKEAQEFSILIATIYNTAGKYFKKTMPFDAFLPEYAKKVIIVTNKSREQQKAEFAIFREKLRFLRPSSVKKVSINDNPA